MIVDKELWNEYYEQGKELGFDDEQAALFADNEYAGYVAYMTDQEVCD